MLLPLMQKKTAQTAAKSDFRKKMQEYSYLLSELKKVLKKKNLKLEDFEAGAAFWHMCDLIWLLLFPSLYLIF